MEVVKGLKPAIAEFNHSEQKLITQVAAKLAEHGFPTDEVTRVHLKNRMKNQQDYYTDNKVIFIINPAIYKFSQNGNNIAEITVRWEDSRVVYTPDGSMEFTLGQKVSEDNLELTLYGLQEQYLDNKPLAYPDTILNKINDAFTQHRKSAIKPPADERFPDRADEKIRIAISHNLEEITKNHLVIIHESAGDNSEYEVKIRKLPNSIPAEKSDYQPEGLDMVHKLKVNLSTAAITLIDDYSPTFFPTPMSQPNIEFPSNKGEPSEFDDIIVPEDNKN